MKKIILATVGRSVERKTTRTGGTSRREFVGRGAILLAGMIAWPAAAAAQSKMSKAQANYQDTPQDDRRCGNCAHFIAEENACTVVEGEISPQAWCQLWAQAS